MYVPPDGTVIAVCKDGAHRFTKTPCDTIHFIAGFGVEGDAHAGTTVQHLSRVKRDPASPNLRQVHLIHSELLDDLRILGFDLAPGLMGENLLTQGIELLELPTGSQLLLGNDAIVEITGLRNPCHQLNRLQPGLMAATLETTDDGATIRKAGVMAIVISGGIVRPGDSISIRLPKPPLLHLQPV